MSLGSVNVILNFAIDLEASAAAFYETAITITQNQELKSLFEAQIMKRQSRIQTLIQCRRKISLEQKRTNITGIKGEPYRTKTECSPGCQDEQLIQIASKMEERLVAFYYDARDKLGAVEQVSEIFDHLIKDHLPIQKKLQATE